MFSNFFPKIVPFMCGNVEKYGTAWQTTDGNMEQAHCMLDIKLQTHTLRICSTYCHYTATMVARTLLNITLHVHCLSCLILAILCSFTVLCINRLTSNDPYSVRTTPLTSKRCILYIYSTNIDTDHFKRGIHSPFFALQNAVCFIILTYLVPALFTFYLQCVLKFKKK